MMSGYWLGSVFCVTSSTLTRLVEQQKGHPAHKKRHLSSVVLFWKKWRKKTKGNPAKF